MKKYRDSIKVKSLVSEYVDRAIKAAEEDDDFELDLSDLEIDFGGLDFEDEVEKDIREYREAEELDIDWDAVDWDAEDEDLNLDDLEIDWDAMSKNMLKEDFSIDYDSFPWEDLQVIEKTIKEKGPRFIDHAPDKLRDDHEYMRKVMEIDPAVFSYASESLRQDKDLVLMYIRRGPSSRAYQFIPDDLQEDEDIALAALKRDHLNIWLLPDSLANDAEFLLKAIKVNPEIYRYVPTDYALDPKFNYETALLMALHGREELVENRLGFEEIRRVLDFYDSGKFRLDPEKFAELVQSIIQKKIEEGDVKVPEEVHQDLPAVLLPLLDNMDISKEDMEKITTLVESGQGSIHVMESKIGQVIKYMVFIVRGEELSLALTKRLPTSVKFINDLDNVIFHSHLNERFYAKMVPFFAFLKKVYLTPPMPIDAQYTEELAIKLKEAQESKVAKIFTLNNTKFLFKGPRAYFPVQGKPKGNFVRLTGELEDDMALLHNISALAQNKKVVRDPNQIKQESGDSQMKKVTSSKSIKVVSDEVDKILAAQDKPRMTRKCYIPIYTALNYLAREQMTNKSPEDIMKNLKGDLKDFLSESIEGLKIEEIDNASSMFDPYDDNDKQFLLALDSKEFMTQYVLVGFKWMDDHTYNLRYDYAYCPNIGKQPDMDKDKVFPERRREGNTKSPSHPMPYFRG